MWNIDPSILALIGAIMGGCGLKVAEYLLSRPKNKDDLATNLRKELRENLTDTKVELERVEDDLSEWKQKYYVLLDRFLELSQSVREMSRLLKDRGVEFDPPDIDLRDLYGKKKDGTGS